MASANQNPELREFWKSHLDAWELSNSSQAAYCREHKLKGHRFTYWKKKFEKESSPIEFVEIPHQLPYSSNRCPSSSLKLEISSRFSIEVPDNFNTSTLEKLLLLLGRL